jgi:hypothetical protein
MKISGTETEFFWRKLKRKWNGFFRRNRCGNGSFRFQLLRNFHFMVVLHGQSSGLNMWPCHIELSKQATPTPPLHWVILTGLENKFFYLFNWYAWVLLYDLDDILVSIIIRFSSVFIPYSFHVCFRKYPFSYLFPIFPYLLLLSYKNIKINMTLLSSIHFHFRSVFIPSPHPCPCAAVGCSWCPCPYDLGLEAPEQYVAGLVVAVDARCVHRARVVRPIRAPCARRP